MQDSSLKIVSTIYVPKRTFFFQKQLPQPNFLFKIIQTLSLNKNGNSILSGTFFANIRLACVVFKNKLAKSARAINCVGDNVSANAAELLEASS